jgi:hypothetical protein
VNILHLELVPYAEEIIEYQGGFWRGRWNGDQIFYYERNIGKILEQNIDVHHLCIDFQAVYGTMEKGNIEWNA